MLTTLGPGGWETVRENPDRISAVRTEVESLGLRVVAQYALMGQYDFLNIIEAPDERTMARAAVMLAEIRDHLRAETTLKRVEIVLFDQPALAIFERAFAKMRESD